MSSWLERQIAKFDPETFKPRNTLFKSSPAKDIIVVFLLALIIIAGEFTFRRIVVLLLPTYFDSFIDLLCLGGFYLIICLIVYPLIRGNVAEELGYKGFNLRDRY